PRQPSFQPALPPRYPPQPPQRPPDRLPLSRQESRGVLSECFRRSTRAVALLRSFSRLSPSAPRRQATAPARPPIEYPAPRPRSTILRRKVRPPRASQKRIYAYAP